MLNINNIIVIASWGSCRRDLCTDAQIHRIYSDSTTVTEGETFTLFRKNDLF
jgi:hypothetical protein